MKCPRPWDGDHLTISAGFIATEADDLVVAGNTYRDNIPFIGIDLHDRSNA